MTLRNLHTPCNLTQTADCLQNMDDTNQNTRLTKLRPDVTQVVHTSILQTQKFQPYLCRVLKLCVTYFSAGFSISFEVQSNLDYPDSSGPR